MEGAGGYLTSYGNPCAAAIELAAGAHTIQVGAGGAGNPGGPFPTSQGLNGEDSIFSTVTEQQVVVVLQVVTLVRVQMVDLEVVEDPCSWFSCRFRVRNTPAAPTALGGPQGNDGSVGNYTIG